MTVYTGKFVFAESVRTFLSGRAALAATEHSTILKQMQIAAPLDGWTPRTYFKMSRKILPVAFFESGLRTGRRIRQKWPIPANFGPR